MGRQHGNHATQDALFRALLIGDDVENEQWQRDGERLAVLETELRHVREAQKSAAELARIERQAVTDELAAVRKDVQKLLDTLTKASGVKMAFMMFGAGIAILLSQFWNFVNWK